ncbi:hypothetical protein IWW37_003019, partial [Coemansia sp. RSA 2050]
MNTFRLHISIYSCHAIQWTIRKLGVFSFLSLLVVIGACWWVTEKAHGVAPGSAANRFAHQIRLNESRSRVRRTTGAATLSSPSPVEEPVENSLPLIKETVEDPLPLIEDPVEELIAELRPPVLLPAELTTDIITVNSIDVTIIALPSSTNHDVALVPTADGSERADEVEHANGGENANEVGSLTISRQPVELVSADGATEGGGWCSNTTSNNADLTAQSAEQVAGIDGSSGMVPDNNIANDNGQGGTSLSGKVNGSNSNATQIEEQTSSFIDTAKAIRTIGSSAASSSTMLSATNRAGMSGGKLGSAPFTASSVYDSDSDESSDSETDSLLDSGYGSDTESSKSSADSGSGIDWLGPLVAALSGLTISEQGQLNSNRQPDSAALLPLPVNPSSSSNGVVASPIPPVQPGEPATTAGSPATQSIALPATSSEMEDAESSGEPGSATDGAAQRQAARRKRNRKGRRAKRNKAKRRNRETAAPVVSGLGDDGGLYELVDESGVSIGASASASIPVDSLGADGDMQVANNPSTNAPLPDTGNGDDTQSSDGNISSDILSQPVTSDGSECKEHVDDGGERTDGSEYREQADGSNVTEYTADNDEELANCPGRSDEKELPHQHEGAAPAVDQQQASQYVGSDNSSGSQDPHTHPRQYPIKLAHESEQSLILAQPLPPAAQPEEEALSADGTGSPATHDPAVPGKVRSRRRGCRGGRSRPKRPPASAEEDPTQEPIDDLHHEPPVVGCASITKEKGGISIVGAAAREAAFAASRSAPSKEPAASADVATRVSSISSIRQSSVSRATTIDDVLRLCSELSFKQREIFLTKASRADKASQSTLDE